MIFIPPNAMGDNSILDLITAGPGPKSAYYGALVLIIISFIYAYGLVTDTGWLIHLGDYFTSNPLVVFSTVGALIVVGYVVKIVLIARERGYL